MKVVLDACVLYPPVLREVLIGLAGRGLYQPLWSARILEEWARAAARNNGPVDEMSARGAIAVLRARFPSAEVAPRPAVEARLYLPDENDIHVLATAVAGGADAILTFNARDFPRGTLHGEGVDRHDPDGFMWLMWSHAPEVVVDVVRAVHAEAERMSATPVALRGLMKRARLNRLAKVMEI